MWYQGRVLKGSQEGRTVGYPTVNLDPEIVSQPMRRGVYSAEVRVKDKTYKGALYYGPRLVKNETNTVLEIFILDFGEEIYGEEIGFKLGKYIRGVMQFNSMEDLKKQIKTDVNFVTHSPDTF